MRKILLAGVCLVISCFEVEAQNKTLGVGVASPNPNAALHVESPTNNQGFLMPRMTSAQRLAAAFTTALTDADKGLMVFDTDLNTIFIWNGVVWQNTGQVSGGVRLTYPYVDSVTQGTGTNDLFALKYNAAEPKRILRVENHNAANGSSALSVYNAGTGLAGYFQVANAASTSSTLYATTNSDAGGALAPVAIYGESTGTGSLGASFRVQNAGNPHPAMFAETKGTGNSIMGVTSTGFSAIYGEATGGFANGVSGVSHSPEPGSFAVLGQNTGGGSAGVFSISSDANTSNVIEASTAGTGSAAKLTSGNPSATLPALLVESNGTGGAAIFKRTNTAGGQATVFIDSQGGSGIWTDHNGATGYAGIFQSINTANTNSAILVESVGSGPSVWALKSTDATSGDALKAENWIATGSAGNFIISDATNTYPAINTTTAGPGTAIRAENSGAGNGFAGTFDVTNAANTYPAIQASSAGSGSGVRVMQSAGTGPGVDIFMQNAASSAPGMAIDQQGTGHAASFNVNNTANTFPAVNAATNGTGPALQARHAGANGDAIYAEHVGGAGSAGNFRISNSSNAASSVYAATNAAGGNAISVSNDANGIAFTIWNGGLQITTSVVTTSTIASRASAYRVTGGGTTFSFSFTPADGEVFMVYNETGAAITFEGVALADQEGKTFIVFPGGVIRGL